MTKTYGERFAQMALQQHGLLPRPITGASDTEPARKCEMADLYRVTDTDVGLSLFEAWKKVEAQPVAGASDTDPGEFKVGDRVALPQYSGRSKVGTITHVYPVQLSASVAFDNGTRSTCSLPTLIKQPDPEDAALLDRGIAPKTGW